MNSTANFDSFLPWVLSIALLTVRLTIAIALSPAFSAYGVPLMVRIALVFALAAITFSFRPPLPDAALWAVEPARLLKPVFAEALTGALLGLAVQLVFAALALAGRLMDVQIGFGIGSIFDPVTQSSSNVLGSITGLIGVMLFVASNAHLELAQLISSSIDLLPLGELPAFNDPLRPLLAAGSMFTLGLALAAPVAIALLLTDLAVGVASRNMPQLNVLVLAIPVKVIVGYAVLALSIRGWASIIGDGFRRTATLIGVG